MQTVFDLSLVSSLPDPDTVTNTTEQRWHAPSHKMSYCVSFSINSNKNGDGFIRGLAAHCFGRDRQLEGVPYCCNQGLQWDKDSFFDTEEYFKAVHYQQTLHIARFHMGDQIPIQCSFEFVVPKQLLSTHIWECIKSSRYFQ